MITMDISDTRMFDSARLIVHEIGRISDDVVCTVADHAPCCSSFARETIGAIGNNLSIYVGVYACIRDSLEQL